MLPLHLCGLACFMCVFHGWGKRKGYEKRKGKRWIHLMMQETLICLCLPGVILALLFCDWTAYPFFNYISLSSFLGHGMIAIYVLDLIANGNIEIQVKYCYQVYTFLLIVVPVIYIFNVTYHTNYMFLMHPSYGSPLEWINHWGREWYLFLYFLGVSGIIFFMYGIIKAIRSI